MSQPSQKADVSVPLFLERRIDEVCLHFEAALKADQHPRIEDYLDQVPQPGRLLLLRQLLILELAYRRMRGEKPVPEEYYGQFPDHVALIREILDTVSLSGPPLDTQAPAIQMESKEEGLAGPHLWSQATGPYRPSTAHSSLSGNGGPVEGSSRLLPKVPGYEILGVLGRGGMGIVYQARQLSLKRLVALKMILAAEHAGPQQMARFRAEVETVARLQHPHIVQIYEVGEQEGRPFCSLELMEGGSLDRKLAGTPQPPREAARLSETLALAVQAAHQRGIIHRDLKPGNILLTADGLPKISDYGLAKQLSDNLTQTDTGLVMGTPSYMAPEQATGSNRQISWATDVYSLGAVLYELLTGRPPFRGATLLDTLDQVRSQEPVAPRHLQPKVPRDLETICLKCLQKDPSARYASAQLLADDLGRFLKGEPIRARPVRVWERAGKWAQRRPAIAGLLTVSLLALLGLGVVYSQFRHQEQVKRRRLEEEVGKLVSTGREAMANQALDSAQERFSQALERIGSETGLGELQAEAQDMLDEVNSRLAGQEQHRQAQAKYEHFLKRRDEAMFHSTLSLGDDVLGNLKATQEATRDALAMFGVQEELATLPVIELPLVPYQDQIKETCYELLLIRAEAVAQPLAGQVPETGRRQAEQALRLLDLANRLGLDTQAYHLRRARYLEQSGNAAGAARERDLAAACRPTTALDYYLVGDEQYKQNDLPRAVDNFEKALGVQPDFFWARYFLAVCYLRTQRPAEAKVCLTACLIQQPDLVWIYLMRGFAQGQVQEFEAAEADFRKALDLNPGAEARYVLFANRGVMRVRREQFTEAIADLQRAIQVKPDKYQAYVSLAYAYQVQKRWDLALAQFDRAIQLEPAAFLYRDRARLHQERQEWEAALKDLQHAIQLESADTDAPESARDYAEKGRMLHRCGRYQEAVAAYDAALRILPHFADAHLWRAEALLRLQAYPGATQGFDQYFQEKGPPRAEIYRARGLARANLGRFADAIQDYTLALDMEPNSTATHSLRGWSFLACNSPKLALPDFEAVLQAEPQNGDAYTGRGYARVQLGQSREGVADAEEAVRLGPASASLLYNAARIFAQAAGRVEMDRNEVNRNFLERTRGRYQYQALKLLYGAIASLPAQERLAFWKERIQPDTALTALRQTPEFTLLEEKYSSTGTGSPHAE